MIEVWDKDLLSDDFMGYIEIDIPNKEVVIEGWYDLKQRKDPVSGAVFVKISSCFVDDVRVELKPLMSMFY
jgi:hypothetical protein